MDAGRGRLCGYDDGEEREVRNLTVCGTSFTGLRGSVSPTSSLRDCETLITRIFCDINPAFHDKTLRKQLFLRLLRRVTFFAVKLLGKLIRIKGKSVDAVTDAVRNRMTNAMAGGSGKWV